MKNSEKAELRRDVRELSGQGYSKKDGIKTLVSNSESQKDGTRDKRLWI